MLKGDNVLERGPSAGLRDRLEAKLIDLYEHLLLYQMRSVYSYQGVNFLKDIIGLNKWKGSLEAIQNAEKEFHEDSKVYDNQQIKSYLEDFLKIQTRRLREEFRKNKNEILEWITKIDYGQRQSDHFGKCQEGTGSWLLESDNFRTWLSGCEKVLFCHGMPGAGKTVLTSIIINELDDKYWTDNTVGTAYLYCEYKRQDDDDLKPIDLLLSLLKQLTEGLNFIPRAVQDLYDRHNRKKTRP